MRPGRGRRTSGGSGGREGKRNRRGRKDDQAKVFDIHGRDVTPKILSSQKGGLHTGGSGMELQGVTRLLLSMLPSSLDSSSIRAKSIAQFGFGANHIGT